MTEPKKEDVQLRATHIFDASGCVLATAMIPFERGKYQLNTAELFNLACTALERKHPDFPRSGGFRAKNVTLVTDDGVILDPGPPRSAGGMSAPSGGGEGDHAGESRPPALVEGVDFYEGVVEVEELDFLSACLNFDAALSFGAMVRDLYDVVVLGRRLHPDKVYRIPPVADWETALFQAGVLSQVAGDVILGAEYWVKPDGYYGRGGRGEDLGGKRLLLSRISGKAVKECRSCAFVARKSDIESASGSTGTSRDRTPSPSEAFRQGSLRERAVESAVESGKTPAIPGWRVCDLIVWEDEDPDLLGKSNVPFPKLPNEVVLVVSHEHKTEELHRLLTTQLATRGPRGEHHTPDEEFLVLGGDEEAPHLPHTLLGAGMRQSAGRGQTAASIFLLEPDDLDRLRALYFGFPDLLRVIDHVKQATFYFREAVELPDRTRTLGESLSEVVLLLARNPRFDPNRFDPVDIEMEIFSFASEAGVVLRSPLEVDLNSAEGAPAEDNNGVHQPLPALLPPTAGATGVQQLQFIRIKSLVPTARLHVVLSGPGVSGGASPGGDHASASVTSSKMIVDLVFNSSGAITAGSQVHREQTTSSVVSDGWLRSSGGSDISKQEVEEPLEVIPLVFRNLRAFQVFELRHGLKAAADGAKLTICEQLLQYLSERSDFELSAKAEDALWRLYLCCNKV